MDGLSLGNLGGNNEVYLRQTAPFFCAQKAWGGCSMGGARREVCVLARLPARFPHPYFQTALPSAAFTSPQAARISLVTASGNGT